ncbi:FAD-dependent thymidylate synthase [Corynebacterium sp.]|uniref:FAD-dependent thymidylate synthase n=1 Tax=Corynebacterium sp. TaxID=1720 RepID=UPI0028AFFDF8|nr:FAD-dependent thymidylate synthase [Corynebacterium sp.]
MNIVTPKIELVASTQLTNTQDGGTVIEELMNLDPSATDGESLVEFAGRGCYESWSKPNPKTTHNPDYIRRTAFDMQHGSILEHASVTLRFSGVSRAWLTEMERHRHLSWSVASQRYIDGEQFGVVMPPAIRSHPERLSKAIWASGVERNRGSYDVWTRDLMEQGLPRKQAREAARSVLPNCVETRGVVTGNLRAWSTILPLRAHPTADAEMQEVSKLILDAIHPVAPTITNHIRQQIKEHA